jgi:putative ABC transport system permease protein
MRWFSRRVLREKELDEEILAHLAIEVKQRVEAGATPEEAEREARRRFGNATLAMEVTRDMWGHAWLESLAQDLKYAVRTMRRTPGFTVVAILTLALGIGANTAMFSVIDTALLRPLPFPDPDRVVCIWSTKNGVRQGGPSPMDMRDFAMANHSFEKLVVYDHWRKNVSGILGSTQPEQMVVGLVPGSYFELLRARPLMGRLFTEDENQYGKNYVAAISSSLWRTRFAADPAVLERTIRINGETYSVVAVMPDVIPAWMDQTGAPVSIWTPFAFNDIWSEAARSARGYSALGRLKHGVSFDQARTELAALADQLAREHPIDQGVGATIERLEDTRAGSIRPLLLMLAGAVGMVLVIACSNLAGLLLARNSVRYRELAVRAALGAGKWRLLRQLFLETLLLSLSGGAVGLLISSATSAVFVRMNAHGALPYTTAANSLPMFWSTGVDLRVLLFTLSISVFTALLFGLAPAFAGTRVSLADTLKEAGRSGAAGAGRQRFRRMLVTAEMALSLVLVVAAGLLAQSIVRLQRQNPGFRADHLLKAHFYLPEARFPDSTAITRFCDEFRQRVRALPGVLDASVTTVFPPSIRWTQMFTVDGHPASRITEVPAAKFGVVDAHYLRTLGIGLVAGRDFADSDTAASLRVALVNEEFARRYLPNENPIGRQIHLGAPPGLVAPSRGDAGSGSSSVTVVGVVGNFMNSGMAQPASPQILALFRQQPDLNYGFKDVVLRTAMEPENLSPAVARQLRSLDPDIPLAEIQTMAEYLHNQTTDARFTTLLLSLFAGLGTILAVIGAYGVVSYLVAQRTHELGIRIALGADSNRILWLVLRQGISMGLAGIVVGLVGSFAMRQFLARLLYGVSGTDPWTLGSASLLLLLVVTTATAVPARRAMRIDPVQALRSE